MDGKTIIWIVVMAAVLSPLARADGPGRIYTKPAEADLGVIIGKVTGTELTHAIAVERDRKRVYLATLDDDTRGFHFTKLPIGRFDLMLVTKDNRLIEGLGIGPDVKLEADSQKNLTERVAKADSFFNRYEIDRLGVEGEVALVFVERIRDHTILRGSGEKLDACLRRLEIIELHQADDDWQMVGTRHLYREEVPLIKGISFLTHLYLPALNNLRIASAPKDLGIINLTKIDPP